MRVVLGIGKVCVEATYFRVVLCQGLWFDEFSCLVNSMAIFGNLHIF